ncbi:hypothetical protein GBAR_LOCUS23644, partial [Geodia barretti]
SHRATPKPRHRPKERETIKTGRGVYRPFTEKPVAGPREKALGKRLAVETFLVAFSSALYE